MREFDLESFLRDDAGLDDDSINAYLPVLKKNKVDEKVLPELTDADLLQWEVSAWGDRKKILRASKQYQAGKK